MSKWRERLNSSARNLPCKKWWFWLILVFAGLVIVGKSIQSNLPEPQDTADNSSEAYRAGEAALVEEDPGGLVAAVDQITKGSTTSAQELTDKLSTHVACVYAGEQMEQVANRPDLAFDQRIRNAAHLGKAVIAKHAKLGHALAPEIKSRPDADEIAEQAYIRMNLYMSKRETGTENEQEDVFIEFADMMTGECS